MYGSNPLDSNYVDLPFDGDQRLISIQWIYRIKDDMVFSLKNSSMVDIYTNWM